MKTKHLLMSLLSLAALSDVPSAASAQETYLSANSSVRSRNQAFSDLYNLLGGQSVTISIIDESFLTSFVVWVEGDTVRLTRSIQYSNAKHNRKSSVWLYANGSIRDLQSPTAYDSAEHNSILNPGDSEYKGYLERLNWEVVKTRDVYELAALRMAVRDALSDVITGISNGTQPHGTPASTGSATPNCQSAASDPDGDGWGWENNQSYKVVANGSAPTNPYVVCSSPAADPDGDGWGWENNQSCKVIGSTIDINPGSGYVVCASAASDPDGDGWGWENNHSCKVQGRN